MKPEELLNIIRALVRPYIAYVFGGVYAYLAIYFAMKFASEDIAKTIIVGFVGIVGTVIGFYYGQRSTTGGSK